PYDAMDVAVPSSCRVPCLDVACTWTSTPGHHATCQAGMRSMPYTLGVRLIRALLLRTIQFTRSMAGEPCAVSADDRDACCNRFLPPGTNRCDMYEAFP
ncbi:MAG: hypothetical protein ACC645_10770, partial [Pirellulales bacterium]